jgi:DNA-binding XRE family transcriptional regulator
MKRSRSDEHKLLVSNAVAEKSDRLLKRVDDAVAADLKLSAKVKAIMLDTQIALKLEEVRKSCGLSQKELAGRMGTSQPQIARLEHQGYTSSGAAPARSWGDGQLTLREEDNEESQT